MTITTKYSIGDKVFAMSNNEIKEFTISEIIPGKVFKNHSYEHKYMFEGYNGGGPVFLESYLFKTKRELVESLL
jgi:hypothetical protein